MVSPRQLLKWLKVLAKYNTVKKEIEMKPKSFWKSKTFWVNVLTLGAEVAGVLPVGWAIKALPIINIGLRLITNQPVTLNLFPSTSDDDATPGPRPAA